MGQGQNLPYMCFVVFGAFVFHQHIIEGIAFNIQNPHLIAYTNCIPSHGMFSLCDVSVHETELIEEFKVIQDCHIHALSKIL